MENSSQVEKGADEDAAPRRLARGRAKAAEPETLAGFLLRPDPDDPRLTQAVSTR